MESATEEAGPPPRPQPQLSSSSPPDPPSLPAETTTPSSRPQLEPHEPPAFVNDNNSTSLSSPQQDQSSISSAQSRPISGVVPPYWPRHERNASRLSQVSLARSSVIRLEDHTADPNSETSRGLWARSVSIDDHRVVQGKTGVGAYVVWNCTIHTLDVGRVCKQLAGRGV